MEVYAISEGKRRTDINWKPINYTWPEFVARLRQVRRTKETMAQYGRLPSDKRGKIKDGPGYVGGVIEGGRRLKKNLKSRSLVTLDMDNAEGATIEKVAKTLPEVAYVLYSTHSDDPAKEKRKFRLVIPLDRDVSADEYGAVSRRIAYAIGMTYFDRTTFDPNRLMYFPSCSADALPVFVEGKGAPLGADGVLGQYEDWRNVEAWPRHPDDKKAVRQADRQTADPAKKPGIIGLFCRAYTIDEGILTFLAEQYDEGSLPNRYTYQGGTSANGLQVFPEQGLAYSYQDSDPAATGHSENIFDLVRLHLYGDLDEGVIQLQPDTAKLPSTKAMQDWAAGLKRIKRLQREEAEASYDPPQGAEESDEDWEDLLETKNIKGNLVYLPTAGNIEVILRHGIFKGALAYDVFNEIAMLQKDIPGLRKVVEMGSAPGKWRGCDEELLCHYFAKNYKIEKPSLIHNAFTAVKLSNAFHPVQDYFEGLTWDRMPRAETCLIIYLGAEDTVYTRQVIRKTLLAAVTRIYHPGTKYDYMPVFVGPQGCGKSHFLDKLGKGKWYTDGIRNLGKAKESGELLRGKMIIEIAELAALRKAEIEDTKSFVTRTTDRYRKVYEKEVTEAERTSVLFGTTNDPQCLKDQTGARRFLPVRVERVAEDVWYSLTDGVIDQIWAEVMTWYKAGEELELNIEAKKTALEMQEKYTEQDDRFGIIQDWLDQPIERDDDNQPQEYLNEVCAAQVMIQCLDYTRKEITRNNTKPIVDILRKLPGWAEGKRKNLDVWGKQTVFHRIK